MNFCGAVQALPYLPRGGDALDDSEADNDPGHQQRQGHFDVEAAALCDGAGGVESLSIPEVGGGRALVTFGLHDCVRQQREEEFRAEDEE